MPKKKLPITNVGGKKIVGKISQKDANLFPGGLLTNHGDISSPSTSAGTSAVAKLKKVRKRRREGLIGGR